MLSPVFILSTGRTGTQFFESYINGTSQDALCLHEPKPSRRFKFLSNMLLQERVSVQSVNRIYQHSRRSLFSSLQDKVYIESSNFMFGCIPALNEIYGDIRIIHMVRHPLTYVRSHLGKGFWRGHKRIFARYVPYWLEDLDMAKKEGPVALLAARWVYVNRQIASYQESNPYLRIRFEDLFSGAEKGSSDQLNLIRSFCGLPDLEPEINAEWIRHPKNPSSRTYTLEPDDQQQIYAICGSLMKDFQYS